MIQTGQHTRLKLAAMDLDGTLLGPDGKIGAANAQAVQQLRDAGMQVVLASGRHPLNMQKYGRMLPGIEWLVSCQGGEVSDINREQVLHRDFLPVSQAQEGLDLCRKLGLTPIAYCVEGTLVDTEVNDSLDFYAHLSGTMPRLVKPEELASQPMFKIICIGDESAIDAAMQNPATTSTSMQMVRTHKRFLEFMPRGVSKATGLKVLAARLGVTPAEVVTFGDGDNDVPMFEWAGASVAMDHGWPSALKAAAYTTPEGPADAALARGVELILKR